jgi:hypothetical protein
MKRHGGSEQTMTVRESRDTEHCGALRCGASPVLGTYESYVE